MSQGGRKAAGGCERRIAITGATEDLGRRLTHLDIASGRSLVGCLGDLPGNLRVAGLEPGKLGLALAEPRRPEHPGVGRPPQERAVAATWPACSIPALHGAGPTGESAPDPLRRGPRACRGRRGLPRVGGAGPRPRGGWASRMRSPRSLRSSVSNSKFPGSAGPGSGRSERFDGCIEGRLIAAQHGGHDDRARAAGPRSC